MPEVSTPGDEEGGNADATAVTKVRYATVPTAARHRRDERVAAASEAAARLSRWARVYDGELGGVWCDGRVTTSARSSRSSSSRPPTCCIPSPTAP